MIVIEDTKQPMVWQRISKGTCILNPSPVAANGHLYFASLPGVLSVVRPVNETNEVVFQADFNERIFATPAVVENNLYLITETKLYAFSG